MATGNIAQILGICSEVRISAVRPDSWTQILDEDLMVSFGFCEGLKNDDVVRGYFRLFLFDQIIQFGES